jgi:hypothetical protein
VCEFEPSLDAMGCWDVVHSQVATPTGLAVSASGLVALAGSISMDSPASLRGWIAATRQTGSVEWTVEFDEGTRVGALLGHGEGFLALEIGPLGSSEAAIVELDAAGTITAKTPLSMLDGAIPGLADLLDTPRGLVLAGWHGRDLWLGRIDPATGQVETLVHEEVASPTPDSVLSGRFIKLLHHTDSLGNDRIGALATVGRVDNSSDDLSIPETNDTHLVLFDEEFAEVSRVVVSSGSDISLSGQALAAFDGRWFVAGFEDKPTDISYDRHGWVAAIEDDQIVWQLDAPALVPAGEPARASVVYSASVDRTLVLVGLTETDAGMRRWAVELGLDDGMLIGEQVGMKGSPVADGAFDRYAFSTAGAGGIWVSGVTTQQSKGASQWVCNIER